MKRGTRVGITALLATSLAAALVAPAHAGSKGRKNTAAVLGGVAAYEILKGNTGTGVALGAGAAIAYKRYKDARDEERRYDRYDDRYYRRSDDYRYRDGRSDDYRYRDGRSDDCRYRDADGRRDRSQYGNYRSDDRRSYDGRRGSDDRDYYRYVDRRDHDRYDDRYRRDGDHRHCDR